MSFGRFFPFLFLLIFRIFLLIFSACFVVFVVRNEYNDLKTVQFILDFWDFESMFCFASICCDGVGFISESGHMFQAQINLVDVRNNGKNSKCSFFICFFFVISGFFWAKMQSQDVCFQMNPVPFQSLSTYIYQITKCAMCWTHMQPDVQCMAWQWWTFNRYFCPGKIYMFSLFNFETFFRRLTIAVD